MAIGKYLAKKKKVLARINDKEKREIIFRTNALYGLKKVKLFLQRFVHKK